MRSLVICNGYLYAFNQSAKPAQHERLAFRRNDFGIGQNSHLAQVGLQLWQDHLTDQRLVCGNFGEFRDIGHRTKDGKI
jgi:hypothetical protein